MHAFVWGARLPPLGIYYMEMPSLKFDRMVHLINTLTDIFFSFLSSYTTHTRDYSIGQWVI